MAVLAVTAMVSLSAFASRTGQSVFAAGFSPDQVSGLQLWLKADSINAADGAAIPAWPDSSVNAWAFQQATGTKQPVFHQARQNGLPGVSFTGGQYLTAPSAALGILRNKPGASVFVVAEDAAGSTGSASRQALFVSGATGAGTPAGIESSRVAVASYAISSGDIRYSLSSRQQDSQTTVTRAYSTAKVDTAPHVLSGIVDWAGAGTVTHWTDGAVDGNASFGAVMNSSDTPSTGIGLGAEGDGTQPWTGDIYEVLVYDNAVTATDRTNIMDYLTNKWLVPAPSPTPSATGTTSPLPSDSPSTSASPSTSTSTSPTASPSTSAPASPTASTSPSNTPASSAPPPPTSPTLVAAGDIACDPSDQNFNGGAGSGSYCQEVGTAAVAASLAPTVLLPLGDEQYEDATSTKFQTSYTPSWGSLKGISRPAAGNHEYLTSGATGYYGYFGSAAGPAGKGYYSYNVGAWHLIALNGECSYVGGCGTGAPEETWLKADLAANTAKCTLAYWHEPRFSSGTFGDNGTTFTTFWNDLYNARVDVILNAHIHNYERFAPMNPSGKLDNTRGIREFVVGTGGKSLVGFKSTPLANSVARQALAYGVLQMTLNSTSYSWRFVPVPGTSNYTDSGSASCI